ETHRQFEHWIGHGYPALYVLYKGRGSEWFTGEVPAMFDWMGRKKRAAGFPDLGRQGVGSLGDEFQCLRGGDRHFYWVSGEGVYDRRSQDSRRGFSYRTTPATIQARCGAGNQINVNAGGFRGVTVWLGPGSVDFDKPVRVLMNQSAVTSRKITPNLA